MKDKLVAFWKYDLFPYLLNGEVQKIGTNGRVEVKHYGGTSFKPVAILPLQQGANVAVELNNLEHEYTQAKDKLHKEFMTRRNELLKQNGIELKD